MAMALERWPVVEVAAAAVRPCTRRPVALAAVHFQAIQHYFNIQT